MFSLTFLNLELSKNTFFKFTKFKNVFKKIL